MTSTKLWTLPLACVLALGGLAGCDDIINGLKNGADAAAGAADAVDGVAGGGGPSTEDQKLSQKLSGYITCTNNVSSRVRSSGDRYLSWIDAEKGLTGEEKYVHGLYSFPDTKACKDGIATSKDVDPDDAEIEKAAEEYLAALNELEPIAAEAQKYYDDEDYKDDKFAKGKELHPKLTAGFGKFAKADSVLHGLVAKHGDALQLRELERIEKEEGKKLLYHTKKVVTEARHLVEIGETPLAEFDLEKFTPALDKFEKALDEAEAYAKANKAEADSVSIYSMFLSAAGDYKKSAKELMRRVRDKEEFSTGDKMMLKNSPAMVDGTPAKLIKEYNDLINSSNGLNWGWYKPNG